MNCQHRKTGGVEGVCQIEPGAIPAELVALPQWVVWIWTTRDDGKPTKVPLDPATRGPAAVNDPDTWGTFAVAVACHKRMRAGGGVGFIFTPDDPYFGIDIDHCRDRETGVFTDESKAIIKRFPTYAEVSPSGTGIKMFGRGVVPEGRKRTRNIEMYDRGRFFTMTGNVLDDHPIDVAECGEELARFHAETFPPEVINQASPASPKEVHLDDEALLAKIRKSKKQGQRFEKLWAGDASDYRKADGSPNHSAADMALCNILAFWCGGDRNRMDSLFRQSGLYRTKWDRDGYRKLTIDASLANRTDYYSPWEADSHDPPEIDEPSQVPEFNASDVATLQDLKDAGAKLEFIWPGWIQKGVANIIAAEGGTGKTRLVADLLRRIREGMPWPDGQEMTLPTNIRSLWVLADNHHAEMVTLAECFGITDVIWVNALKSDPFGGVTLETKEDWQALRARLKAVRPHLLIIDTVGNATALNLGKQEDAKEFYSPLQVIAREYELSVLCLTHLSLGGGVLGRRGQEKVRSVIKMDVPDPEDDRRRIWVSKSNSKKPKPLGMTMNERGADYDHEPPAPPKDAELGSDDPTRMGQQEAGAKRRKGRPAKTAVNCDEWLSGILSEGPIGVMTIIASAEHAGISRGTLYRTSEKLGVESVEIEDKTHWRMPVPR
jgi:putative DNA primase/helicase